MKFGVVFLAAAAALMAASAAAAPQNLIDQRCKVNQIRRCMSDAYNIAPDSPFASAQQKANAAEGCRIIAELPCVVTVDVPTTAEVKALLEESNRLQREQWAAWLRTLEETGVVRPPASPPPAR